MFYLSLQQLQTVIQEVCFIDNENEVSTMLDFYHDLGIIVKHGSTVVLRAQWLIDLFRQLITIRRYKDMVRNRNVNCMHQFNLYWTEVFCPLGCHLKKHKLYPMRPNGFMGSVRTIKIGITSDLPFSSCTNEKQHELPTN